MQSEHAHEARAVAKEASDQAEGIWVLGNFRMQMAKMIFEKKVRSKSRALEGTGRQG